MSLTADPFYKLVCFDLDGTLVDGTVFIWQSLHEYFKTDKLKRKSAYDDYFNNKISYRRWFESDLILLKEAGATRKKIKNLLSDLSPMKGAFKLIKALKKRGHKIAAISGSLDIVVKYIFGKDIFDYVLINKIYFDSDGSISGGEPTDFDLEKKADGLRKLASMENLPINRTVFIGDNSNDLWIAKAAGRAIAFNCKSQELARICHTEIKIKDMMEILPFIDQ